MKSLHHLQYDETLYDFMFSQLPVHIKTNCPILNNKILLEQLHTNQSLDLLFYRNETSFNHFIQSMIVRTIIPDQWEDVKIKFGQNRSVIYFNNNKSFEVFKFRRVIKQVYDSELSSFLHFEDETERNNNRREFVRSCLNKLLIFSPTDSFQFACQLKSLPIYLKKYKHVVLLVIDAFDSFYFTFSDQKERYNIKKESDPVALNHMNPMNQQHTPLHQNLFQKSKKRYSKKLKSVEKMLKELCENLVLDLQKAYQFALIRTFNDNSKPERASSLKRDSLAMGNQSSIIQFPILYFYLGKLNYNQIFTFKTRNSKIFDEVIKFCKINPKSIDTKGGIVYIRKIPESAVGSTQKLSQINMNMNDANLGLFNIGILKVSDIWSKRGENTSDFEVVYFCTKKFELATGFDDISN